jgi:hypothetical protein
MKYKAAFGPALIVAYLIYLGFIPATLAHSIIFVSLVGFYAFQEFLTRPEKINYLEKLEQLQKDLEGKVSKNKEEVDAKFTAVEGEVSKVALQLIRSSSASSKPQGRDEKKIIF